MSTSRIRNYLHSCLLLFSVLWMAQSGLQAQSTWQKTFGGQDYYIARDLHATLDTGLILTGQTYAVGAGDYDQYLLRMDKDGNAIWDRTTGGTSSDVAYGCTQGLDSGFVQVGFSFSFTNGVSDGLIQKLDKNGIPLWTRHMGGTNWEQMRSVVPTSDSGFVCSGFTYSYSSGVNYPEPWIMKFDKNGVVQWERVYYGNDPDYNQCIRNTHDGGFILCGSSRTWGSGLYDFYLLRLNSLGQLLWAKVYGGSGVEHGYSVAQTSDNGFVAVGHTDSYGAGGDDMFVIKTDSLGDLMWARAIGGVGMERAYGVTYTQDHHIIVTGQSRSFDPNAIDDMVGLKMDTLGNLIWARTYGGQDYDEGYAVVEMKDGMYAFAGYSQSFQASVPNIYVVKTDTAGIVDCNTTLINPSVATPTPQVALVSPSNYFGTGATGFNPNMSIPNAPVLDSLCNACDFPTAEFEYFQNNLTISFVNTSALDSVWSWNFGDGNTDTVRTPFHEYAAPGTYTITYVASNSCGSDTLTEQITVGYTNDCRLVLRPGPFRGKDAMVFSRDDARNLNYGLSQTMGAVTWTWSGIPGNQRAFLEFDLSLIPSSTTITSATLDLYHDGHPTSGQAGSNSYWVHSVSSPWLENIITWNNQPAAGAPSIVAPAASGFANYIGLNVTSIVQNQITTGINNGMHLRLQTESTYRRVRLATSDHPDPLRRPQLTVIFSPTAGSVAPDTTAICTGDSVQLTATGGQVYFWPNSDSLSCDTCPTVWAYPTDTTSYVVVIQDSVGCADLDTAYVAPSPCTCTLVPLLTNTGPACNNGSNGSISVAVSGGIAPYAYGINGGPTSANNLFTGLGPGLHTVYITDNNGCDTTITVILANPPALNLNLFSSTDPLCAGTPTGTATVFGQGGIGAYQYSSDGINFQPGGNFNALPAGNHMLYVQDANGCMDSVAITLTDPPALTLAVDSLSGSACNIGYVAFMASGGTPGYLYATGNGAFQAFNAFPGVATGSLWLHVQDANGCRDSLQVNVPVEPALQLTPTVVAVSCNGANDGSITIGASGGSPGYTFSNNGISFQQGNSWTGLGPGTGWYYVRDQKGCTDSIQVTVTEPAIVQASVVQTQNVSCNGSADGSVMLGASGGTPIYEYSLDGVNYAASAAFGSLPPGTYTGYVRDANGCIASLTFTITEPAALQLNPAGFTHISCNGGNDGQLQVSATGGTAPYQYGLSGGSLQGSATIGGLGAGSYQVVVQDANGCTDTLPMSLSEPAALLLTLDSQQDESCAGAGDGVADLSVSGGQPPYSLSLDNGPTQSGTIFTNVAPGTHSITATDANGCTISLPFSIGAGTAPTADFEAEYLPCSRPLDVDFNNHSLNAVSYAWTFGDGNGAVNTDPTYTYAAEGTYFVTLIATDANGCTDTTVRQLDFNPLPVAAFASTPQIPAVVDPGAEFSFTNQSVNSLSWLWEFGDGQVSGLEHPVYSYGEPGDYCVTLYAFSDDGCADSISRCFVQVIETGLFVPSAFTPNDDGLNDVFEIVSRSSFSEYQLQVFSRWGELIFQGRELQDFWTGEYKGEVVSEGAYVWKIRATTLTGRKIEKAGSVTVLR